MTTKRSPAAKLQDAIMESTHAQRCLALVTCMDALIELGFYEDEPINGGDAVEEVARAFDEVTKRVLKPGAVIKAVAPGQPDDLLRECANYLGEIRDETLDGSEEELPELVKKTLKYQSAVHIGLTTETRVLASTVHMLSALREMGFDRNDSINGGDAVAALDELYKVMAKQIFGGMKFSEQEVPGMQLLDSCRDYLQDIKAQDLDGSEPNLAELLNDVSKYLGPAALSAAEHDAAWSVELARYSNLPESREELHAKSKSLNLATISSRELIALERSMRFHDTSTGFVKDTLGAFACSLEWKIRKLAEEGAPEHAECAPTEEDVAGDIAPKWHLFRVQATGGDDVSGDLFADMLVSALSGSQSIAEDLARASVDEVLPEGYNVTHSDFVCVSDRDVWMMVSSDEPIDGFDDAARQARAERQRG